MSYFGRSQLRVPSSMTELASQDKTHEIRSSWSLSGSAAPHSEGTRHHPAGTFPLSVKHKHSRGGGGVIKFPTDYQKRAFCCLLPELSRPAAAPIPSHPIPPPSPGSSTPAAACARPSRGAARPSWLVTATPGPKSSTVTSFLQTTSCASRRSPRTKAPPAGEVRGFLVLFSPWARARALFVLAVSDI